MIFTGKTDQGDRSSDQRESLAYGAAAQSSSSSPRMVFVLPRLGPPRLSETWHPIVSTFVPRERHWYAARPTSTSASRLDQPTRCCLGRSARQGRPGQSGDLLFWRLPRWGIGFRLGRRRPPSSSCGRSQTSWAGISASERYDINLSRSPRLAVATFARRIWPAADHAKSRRHGARPRPDLSRMPRSSGRRARGSAVVAGKLGENDAPRVDRHAREAVVNELGKGMTPDSEDA